MPSASCKCGGPLHYVFVAINDGRRKLWRTQCFVCGQWDSIRDNEVPVAALQSPVPFDEELEKQRREVLNDVGADYRVRQEVLKERHGDFWQRYTEYLRSDKWKDKRQRVLWRDKNMCKACLKRAATQVHHLTYEHVFNEPLFDLIAVCDPCHEALHGRKLGMEGAA